MTIIPSHCSMEGTKIVCYHKVKGGYSDCYINEIVLQELKALQLLNNIKTFILELSVTDIKKCQARRDEILKQKFKKKL